MKPSSINEHLISQRIVLSKFFFLKSNILKIQKGNLIIRIRISVSLIGQKYLKFSYYIYPFNIATFCQYIIYFYQPNRYFSFFDVREFHFGAWRTGARILTTPQVLAFCRFCQWFCLQETSYPEFKIGKLWAQLLMVMVVNVSNSC